MYYLAREIFTRLLCHLILKIVSLVGAIFFFWTIEMVFYFWLKIEYTSLVFFDYLFDDLVWLKFIYLKYFRSKKLIVRKHFEEIKKKSEI